MIDDVVFHRRFRVYTPSHPSVTGIVETREERQSRGSHLQPWRRATAESFSLSTDEPSENGWHEELKMSLVAEEDAIPHLDNRARCSGKNDEEVLAA